MFNPRFDQTYFELFTMEAEFSMNTEQLDRSYREQVKFCHPDRFVAADDREKRLSIQYSALLNQAYACLREDLPRALYLLELQGVSKSELNADGISPVFLMRQMELREELQDCSQGDDPGGALDQMLAHVQDEITTLTIALAEAFAQTELKTAGELVVRLQFLDKLAREADELAVDLMAG
ncbi:MAG: molecular chaperone HscB [Halieaceae bacterium]|jgi:molecular chaperone HscB